MVQGNLIAVLTNGEEEHIIFDQKKLETLSRKEGWREIIALTYPETGFQLVSEVLAREECLNESVHSAILMCYEQFKEKDYKMGISQRKIAEMLGQRFPPEMVAKATLNLVGLGLLVIPVTRTFWRQDGFQNFMAFNGWEDCMVYAIEDKYLKEHTLEATNVRIKFPNLINKNS